MDISKVCCFTGHRSVPVAMDSPLAARVEEQIDRLAELGVCCFLTGGAVGFDTLAALCVLRRREICPALQLVVALPFPGCERYWSRAEQQLQYDILSRANRYFYVSQKYTQRAYHQRNEWLVDHARYCVAYCNQPRGGTLYTMRYAYKLDREIINLG